MSDAQKLIAETLFRALKEGVWTCSRYFPHMTVDDVVDVEDLAAEVDKALGGLGPIYATGESGKKLIAWTSYGWETVTE